jgi:poly-gamma-glutamate capsule biosynthesis protein CapA/YwtB (metallophosphatase superfamily)
MKKISSYLKVMGVLIFLGIMTGEAGRSRRVLSQEAPPTIANTPVVPTMVVSEPTQSRPQPVRILFTGDINLGRCIAKFTIRDHAYTNEYNYPFQFVSEELRNADITVGSLDGSLSDESPPMPCPNSMNLIGPINMAEGLQSSGFDVITIATNHIKDCGVEGFDCDSRALQDTINTLTGAGIQPVGAGNNLQESRLPVIVERNGIRFAFLGIDQIDKRVWATENKPGTAPLSQAYIEMIKTEIISARQIADVVIVMPQWGVENSPKPEDFQQLWAQEFINAGASLVIGNHPHIIQPMEVYSDKLIFYALGNFIFDQKFNYQRESIVVEVSFIDGKIDSWQLHPVSINYYTYQPHWAEGTEAEYILARARGN